MAQEPEIGSESLAVQIQALLASAPRAGEDAAEWQQRTMGRVRAVVEAFERQRADQLTQAREAAAQAQVEIDHCHKTADVLRQENDHLRARLAGHREVEREAQQQAEMFRTLAENSPDLIIRLNPEFSHQYVNPAFTQLTGLPREAFLGVAVMDMAIYAPIQDRLPGWIDALKRGDAVREETDFEIEGERHWFDLRMVPEPGLGLPLDSVLVVAREITPYKQAQEALRRSEERFRLAAGQAGLALFEQDCNLVYTWGHMPGGYDEAHALVGRVDADLFATPVAAGMTDIKLQVLETGQGRHLELPFPEDDQVRWYDVIYEPIRDGLGEVKGIIGASLDITERKRTERELAYRALLLQHVHDAIIATDARMVVTAWNRAAEALYGWPAAEALGRSIFDVIRTDAIDDQLQQTLARLRQNEPFEAEMVQYNRAGQPLWIECYGIALLDETGEITGFVSANRDVTRRHRLEEENDRQRRLLNEVFETDPASIALITGKKGVFRMANGSFRASLADPEMEIIGRTLDEVWPAAEGYGGIQAILPVLDEQASITLEHVRWTHVDGSEHTCTIHARPIQWGDEPGALLVLWETTELENALRAAQSAAAEARRRTAQVEESHRLLEALMEFIPEGITVTSAEDQRVLYLSNYMAGLGAFQRSELEGREFSEYTKLWRLYEPGSSLPLDGRKFPALRAALGGEVLQDEEYDLVVPNGAIINLLINAGPIRDAEGRIFASVVVARDITERKRGEANQRFLSDLGRELVMMLTPAEVMSGVRRRLIGYLGVEVCLIEDVLGAQADADAYAVIRRYGLAESAPRVFDRLNRGRPVVIADLSSDPLTAGVYKKTFAPLGLRSLAALPLFDRAGRWAEMLLVAGSTPRPWRSDEIAVLQDVADRVHLALESAHLFANLQEFRSRFEIALRNAPIIVFSTDLDLNLTWIFNPRAGFNPNQVIGRRLGPESLGAVAEPLLEIGQTVLQTGLSVRRELRIPAGDQETSHDVTVEPLRDTLGQMVGLTAAVMENTELRRMEAEALRNQARIEVQRRLIAEREMERTRIARELHDGPLQDLIATGYTLVAAMTITAKEPRLEKMRIIQSMLQRQVQELRRFCNDLRPPVLAPFGLEKTIRSHVDGLRELNPDLDILLDLEHDGQRLPEDIRMTLFRIYQELMNNVLRHAQASRVSIHFFMGDNQAVLEITDNGVGFTAPISWIEYARTGHLGLVGVQERVQMVGGQVAISSVPGEGTRVSVTLPVR